MYVFVCICVCVFLCFSVSVCVCLRMPVRACAKVSALGIIYIHIHMYLYITVYIYICTCVYIYIYIYMKILLTGQRGSYAGNRQCLCVGKWSGPGTEWQRCRWSWPAKPSTKPKPGRDNSGAKVATCCDQHRAPPWEYLPGIAPRSWGQWRLG